MIQAVIIEDEMGAYNVLVSLLGEYCPQVSVLAHGQSVQQGIELVRKHKPELVFLDIRLPDGDGFEVLENTKDQEYEVIFTTAYSDYREQAFEHFALQYLTKPLDIDKLEDAVKRFERRRGNSYDSEKYEMLKQMLTGANKKIALPTKDGYALVDIDNILRCEAQSNYTEIHLVGGSKYLASKNLKYYDDLLTAFSFYRIHKSHLVNMNYVKEVKQEGAVIMNDGAYVSISQRAKRGFLKFLENMS